MHRRAFLQSLGLAGIGLVTSGSIASALTQTLDEPGPTPIGAARSPLGPFPPFLRVDGPLDVRAKAITPAQDGALAFEFLTQEGEVLRNPVLCMRKGQRLQVRLQNMLAETTTIHWHGLDADWTQTGHPSFYVTPPAGSFQTDFTVQNRGGTYWYHAHPDMLTAKQVHQGLAGMIIVEDEENDALARTMELELGKNDLPLFIQDRRLNAQGQPVYAPTAEDLSSGFLGDAVYVNGEVNPSFSLPGRGYRLRLLNASNARSYLLAVSGGAQGGLVPFQLLGVDGGLLSKAVTLTKLYLAPGERADIYLDLSAEGMTGRILALVSQSFDPMHLEMAMPGMNMGQGASQGQGMNMGHNAGHTSAQASPDMPSGHKGLADGSAMSLCRFVVSAGERATVKRLPKSLSPLPPQPTVKLGSTRTVSLGYEHASGKWNINGLRYRADQAPIVVPKRGQEVWEFVNERLSMPHPMHLHGYSFRVLSRLGSPAQVAALAVGPAGLLPSDLGRKDTVLVWPGERIRVAIDFSNPNYPGEQTFVVHCHNLEHEDHGMMLNFKVSG